MTFCNIRKYNFIFVWEHKSFLWKKKLKSLTDVNKSDNFAAVILKTIFLP